MVRFSTAMLLLISIALPAAAEPDRHAVREACHDDYKAFCADVEHGGGRGHACLLEHVDKVSAPCRAALQAK
jgi:hypothetical protein